MTQVQMPPNLRMSGMTAWKPPSGLTDHRGEPLSTDADFFVAPPPEIGEIRSAYSSLRVHKEGLALPVRVVLLLLSLLPGAAIAYYGEAMRHDEVSSAVMIIGALMVLFGFLIAWYFTDFRHACTYIGVLGVVRYRTGGSRQAPVKEDGFRFRDAAELRNGQIRHYIHGIYSGTTYSFSWSNANGQKVYQLKGKHNSSKGTPKSPANPFYFARSAEIAWSNYLLDQVQAQLKQYGFIHFNIKAGQYVRVGPGWLEFSLKNDVARIAKADIKTCRLASGVFHIAHRDAGWFSRQGKFSFNYASMANARVFLLALDKLVGLRF
jgi:hypothetical protein